MTAAPVALQRCDTFVGRTMNWLYDHLRAVPRYRPVVLCNTLEHRDEFPELEAHESQRSGVLRRAWHATLPERVYPPDAWRLRRFAPRLLHSHFGYVAASDLVLQRALERPWIVAFYGVDVYELGRRPRVQARYASVFADARLVLALGPAMARALEQLGCPAGKIAVHALGVDTTAIPASPRTYARGDELQILFAGTFREKKGLEYLIGAAAMLQERGIPFRIHLAGDAAARSRDAETKAGIARQVASAGIEGRVVHHSWLPFARLLALAKQCHVFVAPSVTASDGDAEGTPFVIQQMMATAMPVVSTVHSDIPYVFGPHAHQLLPERDALAIADRLCEYAESPERIVRDGQAMRAQVCAGFDLHARAEALAAIYDRVSS